MSLARTVYIYITNRSCFPIPYKAIDERREAIHRIFVIHSDSWELSCVAVSKITLDVGLLVVAMGQQGGSDRDWFWEIGIKAIVAE